MILLQETHCIHPDQVVTPHFTLASLVLSKKHGLATFVYEKLSWSLTNQSPERSAIEWLCVNVNGCNVVNVYKSPTSPQLPKAIPVSHTPVFVLVTLTASARTGVLILPAHIKNAWLTGEPRETSLSYTILRMPLAFSLVVGTQEITLTWLSRVLASTTGN